MVNFRHCVSIDWFLVSDFVSLKVTSCCVVCYFLRSFARENQLKMGTRAILWYFLVFLLAFGIEPGMTQKPAEGKKSKPNSFSDQVSLNQSCLTGLQKVLLGKYCQVSQ